MSSKVLEVFHKAHTLVTADDGYTADGHPAMCRHNGEWRACSTGDSAAVKFTLLGAVWRCLPAIDDAGKTQQFSAFVGIFREGLRRAGVSLEPSRNRERGHFNALDAWSADKTQDQVAEALRLAVKHLGTP